ncbi:MAG: 30S ribosomal protein S6 [Pseudomonadota bacterium]
MPLYEHVMIARQDLSSAQAESLISEFSEVVTEQGGSIVGTEYWGLRSMAYKINRNRKGHYGFLRLDAPAAAIAELERRERFHDDVMRFMTIRVEEHQEGQSIVLTSKGSRDDRRGGRGGRDRDDRGPRGDRDRGDRDRGDRDRGERRDRDGDRAPREDAAPAASAE